MPHPRDMSQQDLTEMVDAIIQRFRTGQTGPITFVAELLLYRVPIIEAEQLRNEHRAENAANRGLWNI